jgi:selenophosphate synthetase-related protein
MDGRMHELDPPGRTWLDVVEQVLDEEIDREEAIRLTAEDFAVDVPLSYGDDAERATWRFNGSVTVTVDGMRGPLADWLKLWLGGPSEPSADR